MSSVEVDVDEREGVSGGMETLAVAVLGQRAGLDHIMGVEEAVADGRTLDIEEKHRDLPNHIIRSLQPSDNDRIKEIYCGFSFFADYLMSRRKHRHDVFNAFEGTEKNVESELKLRSGDKASVGILKKLFSLKIDGSTSILYCQQPKVVEKIKRVFLKKTRRAAKKWGGCLIQNTSKVNDASETLEQESSHVHSAPKEEVYARLADAGYRIMTDADYVTLEW